MDSVNSHSPNAARAGGSLGLRREGDTTLVSAAFPLLVEEQAADPQRALTDLIGLATTLAFVARNQPEPAQPAAA